MVAGRALGRTRMTSMRTLGFFVDLFERWGAKRPQSRGTSSTIGARRVRRACGRAGADLEILGDPHIENHGDLRLGDRVTIDARFAPTRLRVGAGATLEIGDETSIGFGSVI